MKLFQGLALTAAVCVMSANPGFAATFSVTNTLDSGAGSLRDAIALANNTADDDIIDFLLAPGPQTIDVYSTIGITSNLKIDGLGADLLTVRGNSIFDIFSIGSSANVGISGLTISNDRYMGIRNKGTLTVNNSSLSSGVDGIYNDRGTLTVNNSTFSGGLNGISNPYSSGTLTVNNSTFSGSSYGINSYGGTLAVSNSTFSNNGNIGIEYGGDMTVTVSNSTFRGNGSYGIRLVGSSSTTTVSNSTISNNGNTGILGSGTLTVTNSTLSGNRSYGIGSGARTTISNNTITNNGGAGIFNGGGTTTVSNNTISGNNFGIHSYGGTTTVSNNTISGSGQYGIINYGTTTVSNNTISGSGQYGIFNNGGTATLSNNTISGNNIGISNTDYYSYYRGTTNIGNTIIAQNQTDVINQATINDNGYNLIGNGDGTIFQNGVNGNIVGTAATPVDAKLGPLADNGGPTLTYALLAGSPAIDAGNPNSLLATDQRGFSRPQGGRIDIGAFELAQATPPKSVPEPSAIWGLAALGLFGFLHKKARLCR